MYSKRDVRHAAYHNYHVPHDSAFDSSPMSPPSTDDASIDESSIDDHPIAMSTDLPSSSPLLPPPAASASSASSASAASSSGLVDDYDVPTCRICFEADGELIIPCLCAGSSQHIHRQCLDDWRAVNIGRPAFSQCSTCHFQYVYEPILSSSAEQSHNALKYRLLLVRDITLVLVAVQLLLLLFAYAIGSLDRLAGDNIKLALPSTSPYVLFYLTALLLSLALLGLFGLIAKCCGWEDRLLQRHPLQREGCCDDGCACTQWDCHHCCRIGGGGGGGGEALIVMLVIVVVVLAVFGIFYGILYGSMIVERLSSRHVKRRWYRNEVEKFRVVDWTTHLGELRGKRGSSNQRRSVVLSP